MNYLELILNNIEWVIAGICGIFKMQLKTVTNKLEALEEKIDIRLKNDESKFEKNSERLRDAKCELYKKIKETDGSIEAHIDRLRDMNTDQYSKIHKISDDLSKLHAHVAESYMTKTDCDRIRSKCGK